MTLGSDNVNFPSQVVFLEDSSDACHYLIARYSQYDEITVVDSHTGNAWWLQNGKH